MSVMRTLDGFGGCRMAASWDGLVVLHNRGLGYIISKSASCGRVAGWQEAPAWQSAAVYPSICRQLVVFGDAMVDSITGTAVMMRQTPALRTSVPLPIRMEDGSATALLVQQRYGPGDRRGIIFHL